MKTDQTILRFLRNPDNPGDRIFRFALFLHWSLGFIPLAFLSSFSAVILVFAFLIIQVVATMVAVMAIGAARAFWRRKLKSQLDARLYDDPSRRFNLEDFERQGRLMEESACAFEAEYSRTLLNRFRYLSPGLLIAWLFLLFAWLFIYSNRWYL